MSESFNSEPFNNVVVILAAGESKRFGQPKQLADWLGQPLLLSVMKKLLACGIDPYVALGAHHTKILADSRLKPFLNRVIMIEGWAEGLSRSIVESTCFFEKKAPSGIAFILADQPLIDINFLSAFFARIRHEPEKLLSTSYQTAGGKLGVPAYFPATYFQELKQLTGDNGAKGILISRHAEVVNCTSALIDIDEPEDLVRAHQYLLEETHHGGKPDSKHANTCR